MPVGEPSSRLRVVPPVFVLVLFVLAILFNALTPSQIQPDDGKLHIVCTFLPMYIFTQNVAADVPGVDVQLLIGRDVGCPHSYSLTGQDLKRISRADVIVANGLGIEPFLEPMLRGQNRVKVITIADDCDVLRLASGDGEHGGHDEDGHNEGDHAQNDHAATAPAHKDGQAGHDHHDLDVNPHTWVSPRQAIREVRTLARKLGEIDPARAQRYLANGEAYTVRLQALAERMEATARTFTNRNIVTGHAAFDYLARDLGLRVVSTLTAIPGETGSAAQMARVIDAIRRSHAAAVFQEPPFSDKLAETIARDAGVPIYPLNPLNSDAGLPKPATPDDTRRMYEAVMEQNLAILQRALK